MFFNLSRTFINFKVNFVNTLHSINLFLAKKFFNYPEVPGMLAGRDLTNKEQEMRNYISTLPVHRGNPNGGAPFPKPQSLLQAFFGNIPNFNLIERGHYKAHDSHFGFYVPNFKNIFFLPDPVSEFIQMKFNISTDVSTIVMYQEIIFLIILTYYFMLEFRLKLFWFLTINPYTRPLNYFVGMTDWIIDTFAGWFPIVFAIDYSPTLLLTLLGKSADSLNHLVLTMPFLPSEGVLGEIRKDGVKKPIKSVIFRSLPKLWEKHPIPNHLREYWYYERPDVFKQLEKFYKDREVDFKPDDVLHGMYKSNVAQLMHENLHNIHHFSTNVISDISLNLHHHHHIESYISSSIHIF